MSSLPPLSPSSDRPSTPRALPRRRTIALLAAAAALLAAPSLRAAEPATGALEGEVHLIKANGKALKDRGDVVVYLEGVAGPEPTPPAEPLEIRQRDKAFFPRVSAVVKGTTIAFPNDDKIFHNVFSMSRALKFDLGLYKSGSSKSVVAKRKGIVDIYCNIHPEMAAKVLVLDNPHFAVTGEDGSFSLKGIPAGTYTVVAWQAKGESFRGEVTIAAGATQRLEIDLVEETGQVEHLRKDGTPYGRYK